MAGIISPATNGQYHVPVNNRPADADNNTRARQDNNNTPNPYTSIDEQAVLETTRQTSPVQQNATTDKQLTPEEQNIVRQLKQTDARVRAHEQAHKSVAGPLAGPIQYEFTTGPDGRQYAIGGEVDIDASPVPNNPEATIRKMDIVIRAALAPADPSPQDFSVARQAQQTRLQAQRDLRELQEAERQERSGQEDPLRPERNSPLQEQQNPVQTAQTDNIQLLQAIKNLNNAGNLIGNGNGAIVNQNA